MTPTQIAATLAEAQPGAIPAGRGYSERVESNRRALVSIVEQQQAEIERLKHKLHCLACDDTGATWPCELSDTERELAREEDVKRREVASC